jgi:hypothetical protein
MEYPGLISRRNIFRSFTAAGRHYFCFQRLNDEDAMIVEDNLFTEPEQHSSTVTVAEICERFAAAGLPCKAERHDAEVRIVFEGRKSKLVFTVNASGHPLTATMPEEIDYDADFACVIFDVFDGIGWSFAPE